MCAQEGFDRVRISGKRARYVSVCVCVCVCERERECVCV
jgi:hypothetical protein